VLRILQVVDFRDLAGNLAALERHPLAGAATDEARGHLMRLFGTPEAQGAAMDVRANVALEEPSTIADARVALAAELLAE
jgi:hypothetical protein